MGFWGRLGGLDGVASGAEVSSFAGVGSGVGGWVGSGMSGLRLERDHSDGGGRDVMSVDIGENWEVQEERIQSKQMSSNRVRGQTTPARR
jgi:hypothetical protein